MSSSLIFLNEPIHSQNLFSTIDIIGFFVFETLLLILISMLHNHALVRSNLSFNGVS